MTIKAPNWCPHAVPTSRGWENPVTGEVYKKQVLTTEQIAEFFTAAAPSEPPVVQKVVFDSFDVKPTSSMQLNEVMYDNKMDENNSNKEWAD
jgi:hypothetical protein|tara:strand:+ start:5385 stop:5660 length:276 start_codon:yes stop_codon:yes gene_type:complete